MVLTVCTCVRLACMIVLMNLTLFKRSSRSTRVVSKRECHKNRHTPTQTDNGGHGELCMYCTCAAKLSHVTHVVYLLGSGDWE